MARMIPDNVEAFLAAAVGVSDTTIYLRTGQGAQFEQDGVLSASNYVIITLLKMSGFRVIATERAKATGRSTDTLTVTRSYGGDTALTFDPGDRIQVRVDSSALTPPDRANTWTQQQTLQRSDVSANWVAKGDGVSAGFNAYMYTNSIGGPLNNFFKYRGSVASPAAAQAGDIALNIQGLCYDGSAEVPIGSMRVIVSSIAGAGNVESRFAFLPRAAGAGAIAEAATITGAGYMGIGTSSPTAKLHVDGPIRCGSYTVATVPSAATVGAGSLIYVSNESGGAVMAFSDGTNWRRVTDRAVIS